jgi:23S rRNA pseudouridine1911/1915/1917 synthase
MKSIVEHFQEVRRKKELDDHHIKNTRKVGSASNDWIIRETQGWLAVNKPPGLSVECQPGATDTMEDLVFTYLSSTTRKPFVGIVHRLDRPTSGIVLFAKKKSVLQEMHSLFRSAKIRKTYLAVSIGTPNLKKGMLEHLLVRDTVQKKALVVATPCPGASLARLQYRILTVKNNNALWEIRLLTGKYHQIRAQLGAIGCPVAGDVRYGASALPEAEAIALHAQRLVFPDPVSGSVILLEAPLPKIKIWNDWDILTGR